MSTTDNNWFRYETPDGGYWFHDHEPTETRIAVAGDTVVPSPVRLIPQGVAFGPLFVRTRAESTTAISDVRFDPDESDDSLFGFLSMGGLGAGAAGAIVATPETDEPQCTRRDILRVGALAIGGAAMTGAAMADGQTAVAEFDIEETSGPFQIGVADVIADLLPNDQVYNVLIDGDESGSFSPQKGETIGIGQSRINSGGSTIRVQTDDPGAMAYIGGLGKDDTLVFETELNQSPRDYAAGTMIPLWSDPIVVDPLRRVGGGEAKLEIGGESIPHEDEGHEATGKYLVTADGAIGYKVGQSPPAGSSVTLKMRIGQLAETLDDIKRGF